MTIKKLTYSLYFLSIIFAAESGGFDNGTSTGKGKFQLDLTWNPFDKYEFGQSYAVISYGINDNFDIHGYISEHPENYNTYYIGLFYQFYRSEKLDLSTAIGIRKKTDEKWNHMFFPQLLYTRIINKKFYIGGSFVNIYDYDSKFDYGLALDVALFYRLNIKSSFINNISIGLGGFHPTTWEPKTFFLPTYSIDIKFK